MRIIAIIPALYENCLFPGKPLALLGGKPMIQRVYETVAPLVDMAVVATDDASIYDEVESFNGRVVLTSSNHDSIHGLVSEAYKKVCDALGAQYDVIVNVPGDEPFVSAKQISAIKDCFMHVDTDIATLVTPFHKEDGLQSLLNPNNVKAVIGKQCQALYFSRSVIPYLCDVAQEEWLDKHTYYKQVPIYGYRPDALVRVSSMSQYPLGKAEKLDQLNWLENGLHITVRTVDVVTVSIDTPDDLNNAEAFLVEQKRAKGSL